MKSLSKCSRSSPLSLGSLLLICCRDDPWILACSSGWEMWVMEWKRTFWKMRGHVGFDAVLFKIQHVRVFFCHCWVKLKPPFPLLLGGEKQEWLTRTKVALQSCPRQEGSFPVRAEPVVTQEPVELCQVCPPAHVGKEKQELRADGASPVSLCSRAGQGMKGFGSLSLLLPGPVCPPRSRGSGRLGLLALVCLCSSGGDVSRAARAAYGKGNGSQGDN